MNILEQQIKKAAADWSRWKDKQVIEMIDSKIVKQPIDIKGQVVRRDAKVIIIFEVDGKYYPNTPFNGELMDTYLHTGDGSVLDQLEDEVQL